MNEPKLGDRSWMVHWYDGDDDDPNFCRWERVDSKEAALLVAKDVFLFSVDGVVWYWEETYAEYYRMGVGACIGKLWWQVGPDFTYEGE